MVVTDYHPDEHGRQYLIPQEGILRMGIKMQHKGGETPYAGGNEKQGKYPIYAPAILP